MRLTLFRSGPIWGFRRKRGRQAPLRLGFTSHQTQAPSVVFPKFHGNDFQCSVPSACKMVTAQKFGFPVKIMRLLPHVCDDAPVLELDCKEEKEEAMHVEKSMVVEKPVSWSWAVWLALGALGLLIVFAILWQFTTASAAPTETSLALVRQSGGNVWIALRANLARILAVVMARLPALAPFE